MGNHFINLDIVKYNDAAHREQVLGIERTCMLNAWGPVDLEQWQQDPFNFTYVAMVSDKVIGYINYDLCDKTACSDHGTVPHVYIYRVAVLPQYRRAGVGAELVKLIQDQLTHQTVSRIRVAVEDQVVGTGKIKACRFFEGCGFTLLGPKPIDQLNPNTDNERDIISFKYTLPGSKTYRNRVAKYFYAPHEKAE